MVKLMKGEHTTHYGETNEGGGGGGGEGEHTTKVVT